MKKVRPGHYQETIPFGEGRDLIIKIVEKPRRSVANAGGRWRLTIDENSFRRQSSDWPNKRSAYHHARNLVQDYLFNDIIDNVHKAFPELKYEDNKPLASEQNVVKVGKQDEHKEHKRNT